MTSVIPFPTTPRSHGFRLGVAAGSSAQIFILPVVRIERHVESPVALAIPAAKAPRRPLGPVLSGGGRRAR